MRDQLPRDVGEADSGKERAFAGGKSWPAIVDRILGRDKMGDRNPGLTIDDLTETF